MVCKRARVRALVLFATQLGQPDFVFIIYFVGAQHLALSMHWIHGTKDRPKSKNSETENKMHNTQSRLMRGNINKFTLQMRVLLIFLTSGSIFSMHFFNGILCLTSTFAVCDFMRRERDE